MSDPPISIFISYARTKPDIDFVDRLEADLRAAGFRPWVDRRKLEGGQVFLDEIEKAIDKCRVVLVVLSDEAIASNYVKMEYRFAQEEHIVVIPVRHRPISKKIPIDLRGLQYIDCESSYTQGLTDLLIELSVLVPRAPVSSPTISTINVSYFYAREDERLRKEFETHLALLQQYLRQQGITAEWHGHMVRSGQTIDDNLDTADIILPLISPDFMASGFSHSTEMSQALKRHEREEAKILPIMLRHVFWQGTPFSHLKVLPTDGRPVNHSLRYRRDKAFSHVIEGIYNAIIAFLAQKQASMERALHIQKEDSKIGPLPLLRPTLAHPWIHPPLASRLPGIMQIGLIALVILFTVGSGLGSFIAIRNFNNELAQSNLTATTHIGFPNTSSTNLSTAQANLTATAQINLTATARQIATFDKSLSNPYSPKTGTLAVNDPLRDNTKGGWDNTGNFPGCNFANNSYHATVVSKYGQECSYTASSFTNFVYQAELKIVTANTCGYIFFRSYLAPIVNLRTSYSFSICLDGSYSLSSESSGVPSSITSHLPGGTSPFINQGVGQLNLIAVVANGTNFDLYVNGNLLAHVSDSTSGQGSIGVGVESSSGQPVAGQEVDFNDLKVWTLP
jgi:hypothetical protein